MDLKFADCLVALAAVAGLTAPLASAIVIPTVPIGDPGNAPDPLTGGLYGSVAYTYNIGTTEVTNAQYAEFLNLKGRADRAVLYNENMAGVFGGILRTGSLGSYTYSTISGRANNPVNYVSFWAAARFANWLHNGQGNGDTENGAYTLTVGGMENNTVVRNAGWQWAVSSNDEWYKAAYHQPASQGGDADDYWLYPTSGNNSPTLEQANWGSLDTTPVGSYAPNFHGTFDMGGNVFEITDTISDSRRVSRGSSFFIGTVYMESYLDMEMSPWGGGFEYGFRVSHIPAPSSAALLAIGLLGVTVRRRGDGR